MNEKQAAPVAGAPLLRRLAETGRDSVAFTLDGQACSGLVGDTVLTAMLTHGAVLRYTEFSGEARAGFCMMGACQDCWVATETGLHLRACSTFIEAGMRLLSRKGAAP